MSNTNHKYSSLSEFEQKTVLLYCQITLCDYVVFLVQKRYMTSVCPSIRSSVCQSLFQYFWRWSNSGIWDELEDLGFVDILSIDDKESIGCNVVSAGRNMGDTWQFGSKNPSVWGVPQFMMHNFKTTSKYKHCIFRLLT